MISIVIPAFNEAEIIEETIDHCSKIISICGNSDSEIVIVDDCSTDKTFEIAKEKGAKVLRHPHNIGYGRSLKDGISVAKNDIIVITDADGTYPIDRIPDLIKEYNQGFDMIVGARQGKNYDESFIKKLLRLMLKNLVQYTAGRKIDDINSGLRVFSRSSVMRYFDTLCDTFSFTTSLTLAYMMTGRFVKYIPIEYHVRVGKSKVKMFKDSLRTLQYITEAILYCNPLKIFLLVCLITVLFGGLNVAVAFAFHLKSAFYLSVLSVVLTFLFFGMGLISVILKQILHNLRFSKYSKID